MTKYVSKSMFLIINISLIIIEIILIYMMLTNYLTKDMISPSKITLVEYIQTKLNIN